MRVRLACLLLLAAAGCHSMQAPPSEDPPPGTLQTSLEVLRAAAAQPPAPEPQPEEGDSLTRAAECVARDDLRGAATHLGTYVRAHPDQPFYRYRLAELYMRDGHPADARVHYEEFAKVAQGAPALAPQQIAAHTRLMEMSQRRGDKFGELFHRGVGLLLVVGQLDGLKENDSEFREEMLCKALRALADAKELKPAEPRVRAYLAEVHARMGNPNAARAERAGAKEATTALELTPAEAKPLLE